MMRGQKSPFQTLFAANLRSESGAMNKYDPDGPDGQEAEVASEAPKKGITIALLAVMTAILILFWWGLFWLVAQLLGTA
jgi:hypothetical protein